MLVASVRRGRLERAARERLGVVHEPPLAAAEPDVTWLEGLDEALAGLPDGQGNAIALRVLDGLDYGEVAPALATTAEAARVRVHRGLTTLRRRLKEAR